MNVNDFFDRVVVINLDRRTDRMDKLDPQLKELGIEYERFSAVDGKELGIDPIVAGTMSHVAVMKKYEEEKVLILEDDALFCENFNEKFAGVIETVPADWDVMYLGALIPRITGKVEPVNKDWARQIFSTGTQAYCLYPDMMQYFIDKIEIYDGYIDVGLRILAGDTNAYITQPNLVIQSPGYSDLRLKEVNDF